MPSLKLTKTNVAGLTLPDGKRDEFWWDVRLPGFGVRLRAGQRGTEARWVLQYRFEGQTRRERLGKVSVVDLDEARAAAKRVLAKVGLSIDPAAEKAQARRERARTLGAVIVQYLAAKEQEVADGDYRPSSMRETRRYLTKRPSGKAAARGSRQDLARYWDDLHDQPIARIDRTTIAAELSRMARGSTAAARGARLALSGCFAWAVDQGLADANPLIGVGRKKRGSGGKRTRVLSEAEIREVWIACRDDDFGRIVRLLLLTGQREVEVGAMSWDEMEIARAVWSLPGARTKNGKPHDVPLAPQAVAVLGGVLRRNSRDMLFGEGENGFRGWSKAKKALDQRIHAARVKATEAAGGEPSGVKPMEPWVLHDLRRTVATQMGNLGEQPHVVEAVLNHVSGSKAGVAGVYNRSAYAAEKKAALERWGAHVEALVNGDLSRAAA